MEENRKKTTNRNQQIATTVSNVKYSGRNVLRGRARLKQSK